MKEISGILSYILEVGFSVKKRSVYVIKLTSQLIFPTSVLHSGFNLRISPPPPFLLKQVVEDHCHLQIGDSITNTGWVLEQFIPHFSLFALTTSLLNPFLP